MRIQKSEFIFSNAFVLASPPPFDKTTGNKGQPSLWIGTRHVNLQAFLELSAFRIRFSLSLSASSCTFSCFRHASGRFFNFLLHRRWQRRQRRKPMTKTTTTTSTTRKTTTTTITTTKTTTTTTTSNRRKMTETTQRRQWRRHTSDV